MLIAVAPIAGESIAKVDSRGRLRWAICITVLKAIALTCCNLSAGGIEVFTLLGQIASTGRRRHYEFPIPSGTESTKRLAVHGAVVHAWSCSLWPISPIYLLTCCCTLYTARSFYLGLYPFGQASPSAYSFFQYKIDLLLIATSGIGYKVLFRTKMRDSAKVGLQTGRRPLNAEEGFARDAYYGQSRVRRFYSFIQLW
ncbi:hypothetical protein K491DRAFT_720686 [Lophiostoma macrostomum CBS 122681]|uniref:Amino acid permease/ SLC12A domain-containing protein n=1 Tax=Lophiostoma macrostomum CBS 122681 TaxID=1314788 RepID=A0A6A6SRV7_9PLEO|nr:hypothetical protein K491DRAFT_720686 [Lophiostoma macrostomum CBS 122681]